MKRGFPPKTGNPGLHHTPFGTPILRERITRHGASTSAKLEFALIATLLLAVAGIALASLV